MGHPHTTKDVACVCLLGTTFFLFCIGLATAQSYTCLPYNRTALVSPCSVYNPSSWAYIDTSTQTLEGLISYTNQFIDGIKSFGSTPECFPWVLTWFCQNPNLVDQTYPLRNCPVDGLLLPPATAVPAPTCKDMCQSFYSNCLPAFQAQGPGIAALLPPTFCDNFTNDGVVVDGITYPCWNVTPELDPIPPNTTCPDYSAEDERGICSPACPSPEYSHDQVFNLGLMQQIVGWISFVLSFIFIIIFSFEKTFRKFPSQVVIFLLVGSMIVALAFMLATFVGGNVGDVWCGDTEFYSSTKLNTGDRDIHHGGLCTFQGWNIVLGTLVLAHWWAALSINCAILVRSGLNFAVVEFGPRMQLLYHLICWGLPLVYSIIAVAATKIDYEPSSTFCFISSADGYAWQIALWFVPMGLCLLVGTVASLYAVVMLELQRSKLNRRFLGPTLRILACVIFFFTVITIIFASQIFTSSNQNDNSVQIILYLICIYGGNLEETCRDQLYAAQPFSSQYGLAATATFFMAAAGIFFVVFFATHHRVVAMVTGKSGGSSLFGGRRNDSVKSFTSARDPL